MMDIVKCKRCRKIFQKMAARKVCPECLQTEEADFLKVKTHLHDFPGDDVNQLSKATGVDRHLVIEFIRGGRVKMNSSLIPDELYTDCPRCGQQTLNVRFCEQCLKYLSKNLSGQEPVQKSDAPSQNTRTEFHFKNLIRDSDRL